MKETPKQLSLRISEAYNAVAFGRADKKQIEWNGVSVYGIGRSPEGNIHLTFDEQGLSTWADTGLHAGDKLSRYILRRLFRRIVIETVCRMEEFSGFREAYERVRYYYYHTGTGRAACRMIIIRECIEGRLTPGMTAVRFEAEIRRAERQLRQLGNLIGEPAPWHQPEPTEADTRHALEKAGLWPD